MAGFFNGVVGWNARSDLTDSLAEAREARSGWLTEIAANEVPAILDDDILRQYAMRGGEVLFKENCAPCHQTGGAGAHGYPTLADDEWIWGGTPEAILTTIRHGIRDQYNDNTRINYMPEFGDDWFTDEDINAVAGYVHALSKGEAPAEGPGQELFSQQCVSCHGEGGVGNSMLGGPPLNNRIFLYGGELDDIAAQVRQPTHGVMPPWENRLSDEEIKQLAVYVHSWAAGSSGEGGACPALDQRHQGVFEPLCHRNTGRHKDRLFLHRLPSCLRSRSFECAPRRQDDPSGYIHPASSRASEASRGISTASLILAKRPPVRTARSPRCEPAPSPGKGRAGEGQGLENAKGSGAAVAPSHPPPCRGEESHQRCPIRWLPAIMRPAGISKGSMKTARKTGQSHGRLV